MIARRLIAMGALIVAGAACGRGRDARPGRDSRHRWDWERMREQPRYDVYERSRFFADGKAMQAPPEGTVPRERVVGEPLVTDGGVGDVPALTIPVPVTPELLATGATRFHIYCAACHGDGGYGGSVVAQNMEPPRPPSLRSEAARALPPGFLYRVIRDGVGRMPPYAAQLSVTERWAVIAHLQQLQRRGADGPEERLDSAWAATLQRLSAGAQHASDAARPSAAPPPATP